MKSVLKVKMMVDAAMVLVLLLLMGYGLVGEEAHEWIGMGMFFLFLFHHILNRKWLKGMFRGRYTLLRIIQTMLAVLIFLCMIGSMISGLILSRYVFTFLPKYHGYEGVEKIHMLCAVCCLRSSCFHPPKGRYLLIAENSFCVF